MYTPHHFFNFIFHHHTLAGFTNDTSSPPASPLAPALASSVTPATEDDTTGTVDDTGGTVDNPVTPDMVAAAASAA